MCSAGRRVSAGEQIASSDAGKAIAGAANAVGGIAVGAAMGLAQGASSLASGAASTVEGGINAIKENSFSARLRKARIKGFRDGIKQGAYLAGEKRHNFIYAYVATLCFHALTATSKRSGELSGRLTTSSWSPPGRREGEECRRSRTTRMSLTDQDCLDNEHRVAGLHRRHAGSRSLGRSGTRKRAPAGSSRLHGGERCVALRAGPTAVEVRRECGKISALDREFKGGRRLDADAASSSPRPCQVARVLVINS
ncbi:MAG: hypothetical protein ACLS3M_09755 [Collinsella sp.]